MKIEILDYVSSLTSLRESKFIFVADLFLAGISLIILALSSSKSEEGGR